MRYYSKSLECRLQGRFGGSSSGRRVKSGAEVDLGKTLYVTERKSWRRWLAKNADKEKEIWLVYYRKETGKPRIAYDDAVEEALCYGWIDSTQKKLDDERFAQRFSPRKPSSRLSQANKERIRKLVAQKKMTEAGLAAVAHAFDTADEETNPPIAPDILAALQADPQVWKNFQNFPGTYKRIRIAYIESRRRHGQEAFERSLRNLISKTAKNERFGYVKVE